MALTKLSRRSQRVNALRSAWMIALMGLLRTSEFLVENKKRPCKVRLLTVKDVTWHPNYKDCTYIKILIRASKTDFWREGVVKAAKFHHNYRDLDEQVEYNTATPQKISAEQQRANE